MADQAASSHDHLPGRVVGIVFSVRPRENGKVYIFLRDPAGQEYFSHISGWQDQNEFYRAGVTQPVSFKVTQTPSGKRAWDVRKPTEEEMKVMESVEALAERITDEEAAIKANALRETKLEGGRRKP